MIVQAHPAAAGAGLSCCASSLVPSLAPSGHQSLSSCRTGSAARHADGDTAATWPACRRHHPLRCVIDGALATERAPGRRDSSPTVCNRRRRPGSSSQPVDSPSITHRPPSITHPIPSITHQSPSITHRAPLQVIDLYMFSGLFRL